MHSDKSIYGNTWSEKYKERDAVLNVNRIRKNAHKIKGEVTVYKIENGIHDLFLSKKPIREKVYENMFEWMNNNFN
jgi:alpha-beta hydrolase superfamily lysophospholipase